MVCWLLGSLALWCNSSGDWLSFQPNQMQSFNSSSNDGQSTGLPPTVISPAQPDVSEYSLRPEDYNSYLQTSEICPWPSKAFISLVACDQITQSVLVAHFLFAMISYLIYCFFFPIGKSLICSVFIDHGCLILFSILLFGIAKCFKVLSEVAYEDHLQCHCCLEFFEGSLMVWQF